MEINGINSVYAGLSTQARSLAAADAVQLPAVDAEVKLVVDNLKATQSDTAQDLKQEVQSVDKSNFTPEQLAAFISAVADSRHYVMSPKEANPPEPVPVVVEKTASSAKDHVPIPQATAAIIQNFDKIDTNNDGLLSLPELMSFGGQR